MFLLISPLLSLGQDWSRYAYTSYHEKDFYGAAYYFDQAIQTDSANLELKWYYAQSQRLANNYAKAGSAYKELMEQDEKINYPKAVFYRADMLKRQEYYEEASMYFKFFLDIFPDKRHTLYRRAKIEIEACLLASTWKNMTDLLSITHPGFELNSFDAEYGPRFLSDTLLLFSSLRFDSNRTKNIAVQADQYKAIIYQAKKLGDHWRVFPLNPFINDTLTNNANPALSPDASQLYFTRCDKKGCAIYVSNKSDSRWELPVKLGPNINAESFHSTHPFVTTLKNNKTYLFFSSNRPKTRGEMDIWSVEIKNNGTKYGRAKNAGRNVNTPEDEITPYYNATTQELYFSSAYHPGFGGFDIFKSTGVPRKFSEPKNVGKPLNSSVNDIHYTQNDTIKKGAFVSNRSEGFALKGETCCNDIYFFGPRDTTIIDSLPVLDIPVEEDLVVRLKAVKFLPLALYFDNDKPNSNSVKTTTEKTYHQTFEKYLERKPVFLNKAPKKMDIDSFFVHDVEVGFIKLQMLSDSLIKYLDMGYKLQLGIKGYTSPLGNTSYNDNLALRRISSIENFLYRSNDGALSEAIDNGLLKFRQIPFGEFFSLGKVSDDLKSQSKSVYSTGASEARKVEIIWVEQTLPGDSNAIAIFQKTTHNFGKLPKNSYVTHSFKFTNTGERPLEIKNISTDCDCVTATFQAPILSPGESSEIEVKFNTTGRKGLQFHGVVITTNAKVPDKKLYIRGIMKSVLAD